MCIWSFICTLKGKGREGSFNGEGCCSAKETWFRGTRGKTRWEKIKLKKKKEQLELDEQIAMAAARLSVLEGSDVGGRAGSDGMNSYVSKELKVQKLKFNPKVNKFVPKGNTTTLDQGSTAPPVSSMHDVRPKVNTQTCLKDQVQYHGTSLTRGITLRPQLQPNTGTAALQHQSERFTQLLQLHLSGQ